MVLLKAEAKLLSAFESVGPENPQNVSYSYWPVNYLNGDPTVIANAPFPLSGVQFSVIARGVGEMRATIQLADPEIRAMYPWDKFIERKTGIVAVRTVTNDDGSREHTIPYHGILWKASKNPDTGRMECVFHTVESSWARRLITGPPPLGMRDANNVLLPSCNWVQADQFQIVRDLLNPAFFSQIGVVSGQFPGWINIDGPSGNSGVLRDLTYKRGSETNLLTAHQDRSKVIGGYEWYTSVKVQTGTDAYSAGSYRINFVAGYPRLGRSYLAGDNLPRFSYLTEGRGNVINISYASNSDSVSNVVWGTGAGYDDSALRVVSRNPADWTYGFLVTEERYSNPDVILGSTLQDQTNARLVQTYANERYIDSLTVRGDLFPYFGTYDIGDDILVMSDDWTWPDNSAGDRYTIFVSRIMGWKVTPPEGEQSEQIDLLLAGKQDV